jgi:nucleotide-binding universal stress UspA family protein
MEPYLAGREAYASLRSPEEVSRIKVKQEREGQAVLKRTHDLLLKKGVDSSTVLSRGDAATEIMEYADKKDMDLIVAGSRGLSRFQGWLMGSVSRKLVHYSHCSVLIVKQPEAK